MALFYVQLQSYQTSLLKIPQKFAKNATKANYLAKRWHLETLKMDFKKGCGEWWMPSQPFFACGLDPLSHLHITKLSWKDTALGTYEMEA